MANSYLDAIRRQRREDQRYNAYVPTTTQKTAGQQYAGIRQDLLKNAVYNAAANAAGKTPTHQSGTQPIVALPKINLPQNTQTQQTGSSGASNANSEYAAKVEELYNQLMGYKPFQYDLTGDLLYRQMADQYTQQGRLAMQDTMGTAAALTGGYGNSYANQVGNQAYQQYLTYLNEQIPSLYEQAYNTWAGEYDRLLQQYQLAASHPDYMAAIRGSGGGSAGGQTDGGFSQMVGQVTSTGSALAELLRSAFGNTQSTANTYDYADYLKKMEEALKK